MAKEDQSYFSNDDIMGGLKTAIERGETLKDAMMSFYNSGYSKENVEEAARRYMMESSEEKIISFSSKEVSKKPKETDEKEESRTSTSGGSSSYERQNSSSEKDSGKSGVSEKNKFIVKFKSAKTQNVSDYPVKKKRRFEPMTIILVSILLFLVLVLGVVFLFKQELVDLFNKWLG